jgi:phosphatidylglycerol lysyltransferase
MAITHPASAVSRSDIVRRTRELVLRYGWNATAYQLVNPGISLWFPPDGDAVVGFVRKKRTRVVAGAPVCSRDRLPALIEEWENLAKTGRDRVCYFGAAGRIEELLHGCEGYSTVVLGAQPAWDPRQWPETVSQSASLRQQFNRARNKEVTIEEWPPEVANGHPDLCAVLEQWLETRGLPPLHFLVEPETLQFLEGRRVFVARRGPAVVGFLVASPIPTRKGWLTEQFIRGHSAPNGTVELLVDYAARAVAVDGAEYFTMGLVPLAEHGDGARNPWWLRLISRWARAHLRRFYNFDGLESFKAKFRPHYWEPIYAISNEPHFSPATFYAVVAAFTKSPPFLALLIGLGKAIRQELRWMFEKVRESSKG